MPAYRFQGIAPVVDPTSYVHATASLIGDVIVGPGCFIGPGASLRGDFGRILVEGDSSIQDCCVLHTSSGLDCVVGRGATVGHGAVLHGCRIGQQVLVGINAVVLDEAIVGDESLIGALALVKSDMRAPARSLLAGNPARRVKTLEDSQITWRNLGSGTYQWLAREALADFVECAPLATPEPDRARIRAHAPAVRLRLSASAATADATSHSTPHVKG